MTLPAYGHIAIITARSGSKRLPGKNMMMLNGLPLMAWTIRTALDSGIFERVILSTDDQAYADTGLCYGAEVPGLRAERLARDQTSSADVVADVLEILARDQYHCKTFMLLQPTSPLRSVEDICAARALFNQKKAKGVVSVCKTRHHPLACNTLPEDNDMISFLPPQNVISAETGTTYYRINGAIYLTDTAAFRETHSFFPPGTFAYIMPEERSVDIDEAMDFTVAEALMKKL